MLKISNYHEILNSDQTTTLCNIWTTIFCEMLLVQSAVWGQEFYLRQKIPSGTICEKLSRHTDSCRVIHFSVAPSEWSDRREDRSTYSIEFPNIHKARGNRIPYSLTVIKPVALLYMCIYLAGLHSGIYCVGLVVYKPIVLRRPIALSDSIL